jgi:hypothetical protein
MKIRLLPLLFLGLCPHFSWAAPIRKAPARASTPKISVDPAAKAILQRAARLYGSTAKWSGQIQEFNPLYSLTPSRSQISIAYIRPNFIRVENREGKSTMLEMADGSTVSSSIQDPDLGNHATRKIQRRTLAEILGESMVSPKGSGALLASLLQGKTGVPQSEAELKAKHLRSLQVKLLPPVVSNGRTYRRIRIEQRFTWAQEDVDTDAPEYLRYEHWFNAQGHLVKTRLAEEAKVAEAKVFRSEISVQNFAPTFGSKTFKFTLPPEAAKPKSSPPVVDPKARQIFARAAELYGKLSGLRIAWTISSKDLIRHDNFTEHRKLAWERRGRLRLENPDDPHTLTLVDGHKVITVEFGPGDDLDLEKEDFLEAQDKIRYQVRPVEDALAATLEGIQGASSTGVSTGQVLVNLLEGINDLTPEKVAETASVDGFIGLHDILLPPQPFKGEACDLVRVTWTAKSPIFAGNLTEQSTLWFSRRDGRLMRVQIRSIEGKERNESHDLQITQQELNPQFDTKTFTYIPPKGAVLEKSTF